MSSLTPVSFRGSLLASLLCLACGGAEDAGEPAAPSAGGAPPVVPAATESPTPPVGPSSEVESPSAPLGSQAPAVEAPVAAPSAGDGADDLGDEGNGADDGDGTSDVAGEESPTPELPGAPAPFTAFLAGDSIVQTYPDTPNTTDQAGWGQMLGAFFDPAAVTIDNRAIGGRTARRFIDAGRLDAIVNDLEPGDFLLVQFGTNDGNRTARYELDGESVPYFLDPATDFKAYLQRYIDAAQGRAATPIFVTPTPRNSAYCTGGNGTGGHANAMRELARAAGIALVDLNARSVAHLEAICPAPTPENFFLLRSDGSVDGTHFQENGARVLASFVADELLALPAWAAHALDR